MKKNCHLTLLRTTEKQKDLNQELKQDFFY